MASFAETPKSATFREDGGYGYLSGFYGASALKLQEPVTFQGTMGGNGVFKFSDRMGLGGYALSFSRTETLKNGDELKPYALAHLYYGAEWDYFFNEDAPGWHVGFRAGLGQFSTFVNGDNKTFNAVPGFGPKVAYDYLMDMGLSLGAEASVLLTPKATLREQARVFTVPFSVSAFTLATLKYWF